MVVTRPAVIPPTDRSGAGVRPPGVERPEPGARDAIAVSGLRKEFAGGIVAVDGIDLAVREGEIFAFLGPQRRGQDNDRADADHAIATDGGARLRLWIRR